MSSNTATHHRAEAPLAHKGKRVVCIVSQRPFETNGNYFCTLRPLAFTDGTEARSEQFPRNGLVWWMVDSTSNDLATPGRVVTVELEASNKAGSTDSDAEWYQANRATVQAGGWKVYELVDLADDAVRHPSGIPGLTLTRDRPLLPDVLIRWRGDVYGPWIAYEKAAGSEVVEMTLVASNKRHGKPMIRVMPAASFEACWKDAFVRQVDVSRNAQSVHHQASELISLTYQVLPMSVVLPVLTRSPALVLEDDVEFVERLVEQQLEVLEEKPSIQAIRSALEAAVASGTWRSKSKEQQIARVLAGLRVEQAHRDDLLRAVKASGLLDTEIETAVAEEVKRRRADVEERISSKQRELSKLDRDLEDREERNRAEADSCLRDARAKIAKERGELWERHQKIKEQEAALENLAKSVSGELHEARSSLVRDFALIAPLLGAGDGPPVLPLAGEQEEPTRMEQSVDRGAAIEDEAEFVEHFTAALAGYGLGAKTVCVNAFHCACLACRLIAIDDDAWAHAYATASGGAITRVTVCPDWLSFDRLREGGFGNACALAVKDPERLSFVLIDGVDRSPTQAWAAPLVEFAAGLRPALDSVVNGWPENLRVFFSCERSESCFVPPACLLDAFAATPLLLEGAAANAVSESRHVEASVWRSWCVATSEHSVTPSEETMSLVRSVMRPHVLAELSKLCGCIRRRFDGAELDDASRLAEQYRVTRPQEWLWKSAEEAS